MNQKRTSRGRVDSGARRGVTLLEIIIATLVIGILFCAFTSAARVAARAEQDRRVVSEAIELAESQFALMRARSAQPPLGRLNLQPELRDHPLADSVEIESLPGPSSRLRRVHIRVAIDDDPDGAFLELVRLFPLKGEQSE